MQTQSLPDGTVFRLDITEAALIRLEGGELAIDSWDPARKLLRRTRPI